MPDPIERRAVVLALKFVTFHDPAGNEIKVGRDWVYMIRKPHKNERGNAVLVISAINQQVMETVEDAEILLEPMDIR